MKNYFVIAALLGVIAFGSVSYLAQAEDKSADKVMPAAAANSVPAPAVADPSDGEAEADEAAAADVPADTFETDRAECDIKAAKPREEGGAAPSEEEKASSFKKCMGDKGHTEDEIKAKTGDVRDHGEAVEE
jgi:hypothetical protein